jgi:signal transduction histidine kinase
VALRPHLAHSSVEDFDGPGTLELDQGDVTRLHPESPARHRKPHPSLDQASREERRRIARDLHDGLAQELAYIAIVSRRLAGLHEQEELASIAGAAERALQETRRVMDSLTTLREEPLDELIADEAEAVAARWGADVVLAVDPALRPSPAAKEALLRVVREAVTNAARHGQARRVWIYVEADEGITLRIVDDGIGFDPGDVAGVGFGLTSMRERIEELGGELQLESLPTTGTTVEAFLP